MEFYPLSASVPNEKRTERLLLRALRATDVELDYDAVMASAAYLRGWSQSDWPADDFTLAENLEDLQRHEREHLERKAFTYTVMSVEGTQCLGCVYIIPLWPAERVVCQNATYAANVGFWVRPSEFLSDLDTHLLTTLRLWFKEDWAFDCVAFSIGRSEEHQANIFREAGLEMRLTFTSPDGREWVVFS